MAIENIRHLILDVDGVLTDGRIHIDADGREVKIFDVRDGIGIKLLQEADIEVSIITGRKAEVVAKRAEELGIEACYRGISDKVAAFEEIRESRGLEDSAFCYCGDDLPDIALLKKVGCSTCPADARPEVKALCDIILDTPGGCGAVRELAERILRARNLWVDSVTERYGPDVPHLP